MTNQLIISSPQDHVYMIHRGWQHEELQNMEEREFLFWLDEQRKFDRALKEAQEEVVEQAKQGAR